MISPVDGSVIYTLYAGENVYGPFEAGFGTQQYDVIIEKFGCPTPEKCYTDGGWDTRIAEKSCAHACGVEIPRVEDDTYYRFLDTCGGHTNAYHFHEGLSCLYSTEAGSGHSAAVAEGEDSARSLLYGAWEDYDAGLKPYLDACGGHFGVTPDSSGEEVYHHHIQVG